MTRTFNYMLLATRGYRIFHHKDCPSTVYLYKSKELLVNPRAQAKAKGQFSEGIYSFNGYKPFKLINYENPLKIFPR